MKSLRPKIQSTLSLKVQRFHKLFKISLSTLATPTPTTSGQVRLRCIKKSHRLFGHRASLLFSLHTLFQRAYATLLVSLPYFLFWAFTRAPSLLSFGGLDLVARPLSLLSYIISIYSRGLPHLVISRLPPSMVVFTPSSTISCTTSFILARHVRPMYVVHPLPLSFYSLPKNTLLFFVFEKYRMRIYKCHLNTRPTLCFTIEPTNWPPIPPKPTFQLSLTIWFAQRVLASRSAYVKPMTLVT